MGKMRALWMGKMRALEMRLQKDNISPCSLLVEPQLQSLCGKAALTTYQHSSFPDPAHLQLSSKCVGLLPNPSPAFPQKAAEQAGGHAAAASATLLSALCLSPCSHLLLSLPLWRNYSTV